MPGATGSKTRHCLHGRRLNHARLLSNRRRCERRRQTCWHYLAESMREREAAGTFSGRDLVGGRPGGSQAVAETWATVMPQ
jgi:hypothetical protein